MVEKENPAPLAGGNRAGTLQASHAVDIREGLQNQAQRRLQRRRHVEQIHRLGARAVFELVDELDRVHGLGDDLDRRLGAYAGLNPDLLVALGADRFPAVPFRAVGGRQ
jgi:hypothetical protein